MHAEGRGVGARRYFVCGGAGVTLIESGDDGVVAAASIVPALGVGVIACGAAAA